MRLIVRPHRWFDGACVVCGMGEDMWCVLHDRTVRRKPVPRGAPINLRRHTDVSFADVPLDVPPGVEDDCGDWKELVDRDRVACEGWLAVVDVDAL